MEKCKNCLHSRIVVSENGYHPVCCLSQKAALNCVLGKKDRYINLKQGGLSMKVKVVWEFEFDDTDFDPEFVDIPGLAKDSAKRDIQDLIDHNILCADDFEYIVED